MEAFKEVKRKDWTLVYNPEFEQYRDKYKNIVSKVKSVLEGDAVEGVEVRKIRNIERYFFQQYLPAVLFI